MNDFNSSFGSNCFSQLSYEAFEKKEREKSNLKKLGFYTGMAVLVNIFMQNAVSVLLELMGLSQKYYSDGVFSSGLDIIISVVSMLVPFIVASKKMSRYSCVETAFCVGKPYRTSLMLPAVIGGVGICMGANIISSYMVAVFNSFGYEPAVLDFNMPEGVGGFVLSMFRMAIAAGIIEEFAFRGGVMGNLRYYGDGFAIAMAAVVFAVIHGNFMQIPFALLSALGMGYFSVKTGTIWTGVIIHVINNALSVILSYATDIIGAEKSMVAQSILIYALVGAGIAATVYFCNKTKDIPLSKGGSILSETEKAKVYLLNAPMVISFVYFIVMSLFLMVAIT